LELIFIGNLQENLFYLTYSFNKIRSLNYYVDQRSKHNVVE